MPPPGTIHWSGYRLLLTNSTCKADHSREAQPQPRRGQSRSSVHATAADLGNVSRNGAAHKAFRGRLFGLYRKLCKSRSRTAFKLEMCTHLENKQKTPCTLLIQSSILPVHFLAVSETSKHPSSK